MIKKDMNMKKNIILLLLTVAIFGLSGCTTESNDENIEDGLTTLFLVDENGYSYAEVPYKCDSMSHWSKTASNGEFSFYPPDNCEFNFMGLEGNLFNDSRVDDIVRIVDYSEKGKSDIPYECSSFGVSSTYSDGSFEYDIDDSCLFYL